MEQVRGKKTWVVPTIFFVGLAIIGLVIGGVLWAVISSPDFFTCFCISYALAFPSYFLWNTTGYLLSSENRKRVLGVLGIIGRYLLAILAIALCFIYLYYTSQSYYYVLISPTVVFIVYSFVILYISKKAKKEG